MNESTMEKWVVVHNDKPDILLSGYGCASSDWPVPLTMRIEGFYFLENASVTPLDFLIYLMVVLRMVKRQGYAVLQMNVFEDPSYIHFFEEGDDLVIAKIPWGYGYFFAARRISYACLREACEHFMQKVQAASLELDTTFGNDTRWGLCTNAVTEEDFPLYMGAALGEGAAEGRLLDPKTYHHLMNFDPSITGDRFD